MSSAYSSGETIFFNSDIPRCFCDLTVLDEAPVRVEISVLLYPCITSSIILAHSLGRWRM